MVKICKCGWKLQDHKKFDKEILERFMTMGKVYTKERVSKWRQVYVPAVRNTKICLGFIECKAYNCKHILCAYYGKGRRIKKTWREAHGF